MKKKFNKKHYYNLDTLFCFDRYASLNCGLFKKTFNEVCFII